MSKLNRFVVGVTAAALLALPLASSAQSTSDLQAQIASLLATVQALQSRLDVVTSSPAVVPATTVTQTAGGQNANLIQCPDPAITSTLGILAFDVVARGQVTSLQKFLTSYLHISENIVTGFYGSKTVAYVKQFQASQDLEQTGSTGPLTRTAIFNVCTRNNPIKLPIQVGTSAATTSLTALPYPGYTGQTVAAGTNNVKLSPFILTAGSGEGVLVNTVTIKFNSGEATKIQNLWIADENGTGLSNTIVTPSDAGNSFTTNFVVPAGGSRTLEVFANVLSSARGSVQPTITTSTTGTGVSTGTSVSIASNVSLQVTTISPPSDAPTATIDQSSLTTTSSSPVLTGSASGLSAVTINISSLAPGGGGASAVIPVTSSRWSAAVNSSVFPTTGGLFSTPVANSGITYLADGSYQVTVYGPNGGPGYFAQGVLTVHASATSTAITVTAPNGGEQWEEGVINSVTWSPYNYNPDVNPSRDVTAYLERNDGKGGSDSFTTLGKVEESGKASIHWITGELNSASKGGDLVPPGKYYIRVVNNVTGAWDRSDAPFVVLPKSVDVKVNGSDGPVTLASGQNAHVTWTSSGTTQCTLYDSFTTADTITGLPSSGSRDFHFAGDITNGQVSVNCVKPSGINVYDYVVLNVSASPQNASLTVTRPTGVGEQIRLGQPYKITWNQTGLSTIAIALYRNDQWFAWIDKSAVGQKSANSSYSYTWDLGANPWNVTALEPSLGNVYKIYITGQKTDGTGYIDDKSDSPFGFIASASSPTGVSISASPASGTAPLTTTFWAVGAPKSTYSLDFGDGTSCSGSECNLVHTYLKAGTYTATISSGDYFASTHVTVTAASTLPTPVVNITASPTAITSGGSSTVSWTSSNANRCYLSYATSQDAVATSGSRVVSPTEKTTYQLWCANDPGTGKDGPAASASVTVTVGSVLVPPTPPPPPPTPPTPPPVCTLMASPTSVTLGGTSMLTWTTTGAKSVSFNLGIEETGLNGHVAVSPYQTTTYVMVATGAGGSSTCTASVSVGAATSNNSVRMNVQANNSTAATSDIASALAAALAAAQAIQAKIQALF